MCQGVIRSSQRTVLCDYKVQLVITVTDNKGPLLRKSYRNNVRKI